MAGFDVKLTITGLQQAQAEALRIAAALEPNGAVGQAVKYVTLGLHRYAVAYTHIGQYVQSKSGSWYYHIPGRGGGSLRASHRVDIGGDRGEVFIDPGARNPLTGRAPAEYGVYEFARGGEHDAYTRAVEGHADQLVDAAMARYLR
jgi:hypothetical protein